MSTNEAEPLTDAELDLLATLDAKRTPGPVDVLQWPGDGDGYQVCEVDGYIVRSRCAQRAPAIDDARAIAAALNALPALLAEVRRGRARAPAPDAWAEPDGDDGVDVASDDGPRLHIPRDLLTRPEGR